jgi:hypothetical protein
MKDNCIHRGLTALAAAGALGFASAATAADKAPPEIPKCDKRYGALAVHEPEDKWWRDLQLESPEALIKVFVAESKCFTLVDRGKGLDAAQAERALASGGDLRGGSNVGRGQPVTLVVEPFGLQFKIISFKISTSYHFIFYVKGSFATNCFLVIYIMFKASVKIFSMFLKSQYHISKS